MEQEAYVQPVLFQKTNQAVEAAQKALCAQHGGMAGRSKARAMTLKELITLGETLLNANGNGGKDQDQDTEVYVPVTMFQDQGGR